MTDANVLLNSFRAGWAIPKEHRRTRMPHYFVRDEAGLATSICSYQHTQPAGQLYECGPTAKRCVECWLRLKSKG